MKRNLVAFACVLFSVIVWISSCTIAQDRVVPAIELEKVQDITGFYYVSGKMGQESYSGMASIRKAKDTYIVRWMAGPSDTLGVGVRIGDELVVGWTPLEVRDGKPAAVGVTRYRIQPGKLVGRWAVVPGSGDVGDESLEWLKGTPDE